MPSGYDTFNNEVQIDSVISESFALISTWDGRKILRYESLGRSTREEFTEAEEIMHRFIGRKGVFLPKVIIVDGDDNHIETTNRTKLPLFERIKKSDLLNYDVQGGSMPLTNPAEIRNELELKFKGSKYNRKNH